METLLLRELIDDRRAEKLLKSPIDKILDNLKILENLDFEENLDVDIERSTVNNLKAELDT